MDPSCLVHRLTDEERRQFEETGLLIIKDVLPPDLTERLAAAVDRIWAREREEKGISPHDPLFYPNFVGKDDVFVELLDWPLTFPKVWGILGWNIYLYHSHLGVTPPVAPGTEREHKRLGWHQDSGRVNVEMESHPRPRLSLKVGYFLSDTTQAERGNFYVIPGSHLRDALEFPEDGVSNPPGATPVCVPSGTAVLFDRRLWHSASLNYSTITRKVLFYGYGYRWLRTKDDMTVAHVLEGCTDPIRRQLLGDGINANGRFSPTDADVPLKGWLEEHAK
ncbi:MAG: phytanoyl-CoA dioxygenase family protein [Candidatus Latescibacteria bacterium]|nr:phytanoyl-CoA dioxygenase family protein [Candidatus Latescibacterota bacterium]